MLSLVIGGGQLKEPAANCSEQKAQKKMEGLDRNGRKRKVYLARHNPYRKWSEGRFVRKYRLSKKRVKKISKRFGAWSDRTQGSKVGGGLSYIEQVSDFFSSR